MQIVGTDKITYILLNGIEILEDVHLSENLILQTADTSHLDFNTAVLTCKDPNDIAVVVAFIPLISAQLRVIGDTSEELAVFAWNSTWDVILISAIFHSEIGCNLQSNVPANEIGVNSYLKATNFHMRGLTNRKPYKLTNQDAEWLNTNFSKARGLMQLEHFNTAVHCLASYRWHTMPRIQLAVLWAGIEGIFGASTEIRFRISLYISRFLYPESIEERKQIFESIKKLYNIRSIAVHGSNMKGNNNAAVSESAEILKSVILKCIVNGALPKESDLVP